MIRQVTLNFGPAPDQQPLSFRAGSITVFVGPNNSGKSLVLRELEVQIHGNTSGRILRSLTAEPLTRTEIEVMLDELGAGPPSPSGDVRVGTFPIGGGGGQEIGVNPDRLFTDAASGKGAYQFGTLARLFTRRFDGRTRLSLLDNAPAGSLKTRPGSIHMALLANDSKRARVREVIHGAFRLHFVVDPTNMATLQISLADSPPPEGMERALTDDAIEYFSAATPISEFSDGVRAFAGLIAAAVSSNVRIMLLDEADAFLHPPLSRRLGRELTILASERKGNVFASTHSPDFVMGCIQSGRPVNIVRLTYGGGIATARVLPGEELQRMMQQPLLRSTGVLSALFHQGAVVVEGNSDRAFYQEINERLLAAKRPGVIDGLFLDALNKQSIPPIIAPLRRMGIPAAGVVDLDILKKGDEFKALLHSGFVPQLLINSWGQLRGEVNAALERVPGSWKSGGIYSLGRRERESAATLLEAMAEYGLFVVPGGTLESWLPELGATGQKNRWVVSALEKLGADPTQVGYVHPAEGDVWAFLERVGAWIINPERRGIPTSDTE